VSKLFEHVSFSSIKDWKTCPRYFKLTRIDKVGERVHNLYTEFGSAMHGTLERAMKGEIDTSDDSLRKDFNECYDEFLKNINVPKDKYPTKKEIEEFRQQGLRLVTQVLPAMKESFGEYEVIDTEQELYEDITIYEKESYKFKGFIDIVIKTKDGKYHIIDWKTTSWGWKAEKKGSPMVTYQLTYYKKYFAEKNDIDPKMVETHFCLLKRTAKTNAVELFRVTSGPRKTNNALKLLHDCVYNADTGNHIKNKLSCTYCDFNRTEYCTGAN
jgi:RecB family exonuclease